MPCGLHRLSNGSAGPTCLRDLPPDRVFDFAGRLLQQVLAETAS
jgi:hypothetical protein